MPKYHIERSIEINAPIDTVNKLTTDFSEWPVWSPWLCMEPDAQLDVFGTPGQSDHGYTWTGELTGEGKMQTSSIENGLHKMELNFIKPFRSNARVELDVQTLGDNNTHVTWHMYGALPFFMFFYVDTMKSMIGMDYERGLRMLKEYAETGKVNARTEIVGVVDIPETRYIGIETQSSMADMQASMSVTFPKVDERVNAAGVNRTPVPAGAIYNDMNLKNQHVRYTAFIPVDSAEQSAGYGTTGDCKAIKVVHHGAYHHLGNSWGAAMSYQRYKKHKPLKQKPPFELYMNDPETTDASDLVTEIYVPLKR